jgi:hypothetical protein
MPAKKHFGSRELNKEWKQSSTSQETLSMRISFFKFRSEVYLVNGEPEGKAFGYKQNLL